MSYYILPKKHNTMDINPKLLENNEEPSPNILKPIVSYSLVNYLGKITQQIKNYYDNNTSEMNLVSYDMICKIINPYEFIFSKVPGLNIR